MGEWMGSKRDRVQGLLLALAVFWFLPGGPARAGCGDHTVVAKTLDRTQESVPGDPQPAKLPSCSGAHCSRPSPLAPAVPLEEQKIRIGKPVLDSLLLLPGDCNEKPAFLGAPCDIVLKPLAVCDIFRPPRA